MSDPEQIALWADQLRALAAEGLCFSTNAYDRERYRTLQDLSMAMTALVTGWELVELESLRGTLFSQFTPLVGGDAAIIDDGGRVLLGRRADDGTWSLPGGALQVGETPAEGVVREVREETGLTCEPVALVGVFDIRPGRDSRVQHVYLITFLCRPVNGLPHLASSHAHETLDLGWFPEDDLPADLTPHSASRLAAAFCIWREGGPAWFDR